MNLPKKNKNKKSPRKFRGINATTLAESYIQVGFLTEAAFRTNPIEFLISPKLAGTDTRPIGADGAWTVSLPEILRFGVGKHAAYGGATLGHIVSKNLGIGGNNEWIMTIAKVVGTGIAFRAGTKILRRPRARVNALLRQLQLGSMVRV